MGEQHPIKAPSFLTVCDTDTGVETCAQRQVNSFTLTFRNLARKKDTGLSSRTG